MNTLRVSIITTIGVLIIGLVIDSYEKWKEQRRRRRI